MKKEYDFSKMKRRPGPVKVIPPGASVEVRIHMSLRLLAETSSKLRDEATRLGIPYQTLIGSILHRYVNGQFIDAGTPDKNKKGKE